MAKIDRSKWPSLAVIDKAKDCIVTLTRAESIQALHITYPELSYRIVDMTGKGWPKKEGYKLKDQTVDENGEWKWKVTEQEAIDRKALFDKVTKQELLVDLLVKKDKAEKLGEEFTDLVSNLQIKIDQITATIAEM